MKTKRIASGGLEDGFECVNGNDWTHIHYAAGKFFIKNGENSKLRQISPREAVKIFIKFINNGEASSCDLTPLIKAVDKIGNELPFSNRAWKN